MNRYIIGSLWDRANRIGANKNFEYLFEGSKRVDALNSRADNILIKSNATLNEAQKTNNMNKDVQQQINALIAESGTSDTEIIQSRIDAEGNEFTVLKERLDTENVIAMNYLKDFGINVKNKGAVGDGVADDTQTIQNAIDALPPEGGVIYFPRGEYRTSGEILLKDNVTIKGAGIGLTFIRPTDTGVDYQYVFYANGQSSNRMKNITLTDFTLDPIDPIPTSSAMRFYNTIRINYTDTFSIERVESTLGHTNIASTDSTDFIIRDIICRNNTDAAVALFTGARKGLIENVTGEYVSEVVDFFNNEDVLLRNLDGIASSPDNEALDMSSSRRITVRDSKFTGFGNVIKFKVESDIPFEDYVIDNCSIIDFSGFGVDINLSSVASGDDPFGQRAKITNCKMQSTQAGSRGINYESLVKITDFSIDGNDINCISEGISFRGNHENTKIKNNDVVSSASGILVSGVSAASPESPEVVDNTVVILNSTATAIEMDRCYNATVKRNTVATEGNGILIKDVSNPNVGENEIDAGFHGIEYRMTLIRFLNVEQKVVGASFIENKVKRYGTNANYRSGIYVYFNLGSAETGTYNILKVSGNKVNTPASNTNTTYALYFNTSNLEGIDNALVVNNELMNATNNMHGTNNLLAGSIIKDNIEFSA